MILELAAKAVMLALHRLYIHNSSIYYLLQLTRPVWFCILTFNEIIAKFQDPIFSIDLSP